MGNVPISCCRTKSPRLERNSSDRSSRGEYRNGSEYSHRNHDSLADEKHQNRAGDGANQASHILQHISEREPDDSETDPSSNPFNRPIFAARSSISTKYRSNSYIESYSSDTTVPSRRQTFLTCSQDHGYNSATSTNLTQYDGQLNDSFDTSIQRSQQRVKRDPNELINSPTVNSENSTGGNRWSLANPKDGALISQTSPCSNDIGGSHVSLEPKSLYRGFFKSSSCSSIFIDNSTISQPDLELTIKCVSLAIHYHIKNRTSDKAADIFDESIHPLKMPESSDTDRQEELLILDQNDDSQTKADGSDEVAIYNFVKTLFKAAQLTSEYAITTLVYLERLMTYAEMDLTPRTWRRMFLGAILLSSKVWEDQAVWNVDYAQILEEISVEEINELERQYLELIQFNMNVPSSVYAKYYFYLRTLALKNGLNSTRSLLTVGKAKTMEAMSRVTTSDWQSSPIHRKASPIVKRHTSLEKLRLNGHAVAVLM